MYKSQIKTLELAEVIASPLQSVQDKTLHVVNGLQLNLDHRPCLPSKTEIVPRGPKTSGLFPFVVREHDNFPTKPQKLYFYMIFKVLNGLNAVLKNWFIDSLSRCLLNTAY